jgi:hypothetical protein
MSRIRGTRVRVEQLLSLSFIPFLYTCVTATRRGMTCERDGLAGGPFRRRVGMAVAGPSRTNGHLTFVL